MRISQSFYIGACWANDGIHPAGAFRSWEKLDVPKKMIIGPPIYLNRPLYQLQHEAVRWFDHWLKGKETGIMDEPKNPMELAGTGSLKRQSVNRVTLYRNADYPSCLVLPVTRGNLLQTCMSGGKYPGTD